MYIAPSIHKTLTLILKSSCRLILYVSRNFFKMSSIEDVLQSTTMQMLDFETQIFLEILHKDGLVVAAKGLNLDRVLINVFKVYSDPGNLVIVLNCTEKEEKYFIDKMKDENVHSTTFTTSIPEREDVYLTGGIHFVTTRILVVDLLKKRIPIEKITGIIILRAHNILESCQEAFVIRLYRQHNKTGFIKAFSNNAQSFTMGFGHVERVMRTLFIKELYLWPRFHSVVIQSLKDYQPEVIELHIPISDTYKKIQTCLLDLMNLTVKELQRINKTIELQEITVENCLTKQFHKILQLQLDCIWHQLSSRSKQLVADLKTLRHLVVTMLHADPVTFYSILSGYRTMEYAHTSTWVLLDPAELLFTQASKLIFNENKELNPQFCPKWNTLLDILKNEIPAQIKDCKLTNSKVLILCQDTKTCYQLNQFLTHGPHHYLFLMALKHNIKFKTIAKNFKNCEKLAEKFTQKQEQNEPSTSKYPKRVKIKKSNKDSSELNDKTKEANNENAEDELENLKSTYILSMSQITSNNLNETENSEYIFEPFSQLENMDISQLCEAAKENPNPTVLIQTFKYADEFMCLKATLEEIKPSFIILYHCNMAAIRQIELYEGHRNKTQPLRIYFLIHAETVEEQSYLTTLRREKEAFEHLIQCKSTMVVSEEQDGITEDCTSLQRDIQESVKSTRQGGKSETNIEKQVIIVDMREFRSELPALIHKRNIDIEPATITIGDYILTPEICVERKSLSDLVGSLNSGRLYQQCTQMTRFYAKPMLLIEFDQNKPFSWQSSYMISKDSNNFDVQQKLLLLTLHFPKLKLVWSASPYASAQLFEELKQGKEQPNVEYAISVGNNQDADIIETNYNTQVYDFIQKLPGVTSKNIDNLLRNGKNLDCVIKKSEDELKELLGNSIEAKQLYSIIHEEHGVKENGDLKKQKSRIKNKFKYVKK